MDGIYADIYERKIIRRMQREKEEAAALTLNR